MLLLLMNIEQTVSNYSLSFDIWLLQQSKWTNIRSKTPILEFSLDSVDTICIHDTGDDDSTVTLNRIEPAEIFHLRLLGSQ